MDYKKHSYDKCRFPLYFILTARNAILSGGLYLCIYLFDSLRASLLAGYLFGGIGDAGGYHC